MKRSIKRKPSLNILIVYGGLENIIEINMIKRRILRVLFDLKNDVKIVCNLELCKEENKNTIFIQLSHDELDLKVAKCYERLLSFYVNMGDPQQTFYRLFKRIRLGNIPIFITRREDA